MSLRVKNNMHRIVRPIYHALMDKRLRVSNLQIKIKSAIEYTPYLTYKNYQASSDECYVSVQDYINSMETE